MIEILLLFIPVTLMTFCFYMLIRNEQVFRERMKVQHAIFKQDNEGNYINNMDEVLILKLLRKT